MVVQHRSKTLVWHRRKRGPDLTIWLMWIAGAAILVYSWRLISDRTIWPFVLDAPAKQPISLRVWCRRLELHRGAVAAPMWDTINMATLGTALAVVLAVPVAYCAARNTTPSVAAVRPVALFIIVSSRSINALIWVLMLVTIIGPGVLAGSWRSRCARSASAPSCSMNRSKK